MRVSWVCTGEFFGCLNCVLWFDFGLLGVFVSRGVGII